MGKVPCCDKEGLKKGPWTAEEDQKLIDYIQKHGHGRWRILPKNAGMKRCGKSCRLRWKNNLRHDIKRGRFSFEEEETMIQLHCVLGNNDVNSDEAVSTRISLKALILNAFYGLLNSLKTAAIKVVELIFEALVYLLNSDVALGFFEAFHTVLVFLFSVLGGLITLRFQPFHISPLETHFATFLVFIVATIVYGIAYVLITLQPPDSEYRAIFRFICLVFGIIAIELLVSTIIPPHWLFIVNLWLILILGVLCLCKQIYQLLCYTIILAFNAVPSLFEKIYQLVHQIYDWLLQIFQSAICQAFSSREREDNDNQGLEMV